MAYRMDPKLLSTHRRLRTEMAHRHMTPGRLPVTSAEGHGWASHATGIRSSPGQAMEASSRWRVELKGRTQELEHSRSNLQQASIRVCDRLSRGDEKLSALRLAGHRRYGAPHQRPGCTTSNSHRSRGGFLQMELNHVKLSS